MKNPFDDPELEGYLKRAAEEMIPQMENSAISVAILTDKPDPKICLELGAMILLDKPIVVFVPRDIPVPANLKRCAAAIIHADHPRDPRAQQELHDAITRILAQDKRAKASAVNPASRSAGKSQ